MPVISTLGAASSRGFGEFNQSSQANYIENYFSTTLYTGYSSGAFNTQITNNIPLGTTAAWTSALFSGSQTDLADITVDSSGNIYIAGYSGNGNCGYIAKLTPSFSIVWQKEYAGAARFYAIKVASSGNVYAAGYTAGNLSVTVKYNSSGTLQWQRTIAPQAGYASKANDLVLGSSEDVYVVGETRDATRLVAYAIKYNSSGTIQWQRTIYEATTAGGYAYGVAIDSSDNIYVSITSTNGSSLVKLNSSGTFVDANRFLAARGLGRVVIDSSGNIYRAFSSTANVWYVAKYNSSMVLQWQKAIDSTYLASTMAYLAINSSGEIFAYITLQGYSSGLVKLDSSGNILWQRTISPPANNQLSASGLSVNSSGDVYLSVTTLGSATVLVGLKDDGTTKSGYANVGVNESNYTISAGALTTGANVLNVATSSFTTATPTATDSTPSITIATTTQPAVTGSDGMVWIKARSTATDHAIYDTVRGAEKDIASNLTTGQTTQSTGLISFGATGPLIGTLAKINSQSNIFAAWTFREKAKFFDIVTYTGNGANRTISHNLGSVPGCIMIKRTDTTAAWAVYHRSLANTQYLVLNTTAIPATGTTYWNSTTPTDTVFSLGTSTDVNASGGTYVAYLFAHNAGGFGLTGSDSVISCGSFTATAGGVTPSVTLGWEPQYLLFKTTTTTLPWLAYDTVRGLSLNNNFNIQPTNTNAEASAGAGFFFPTATGFSGAGAFWNPNETVVYIAIRRGPMKVPTDGTTVFQPTVYTGTNVNNRLVNTTIAPDMVWVRQRNSTSSNGMVVGDRLRGQPYLSTGWSFLETTSATALDQQIVSGTEYGTAFSSMTGFYVGNDTTAELNVSTTASNQIAEAFKRAPSFLDVVCYTGTGSASTISHNLGVAPRLMLVKRRNSNATWAVYNTTIGAANVIYLNSSGGFVSGTTFWNSTAPTASVFSVGTATEVNASGGTYVAYLFGDCTGVSKVGSYTGTGTTQQINCGFTSGARLVLIKRTDSTGDWYIYDSARGIVAGNDPYLLLNSTAAEVTSTDYVDAYSAGFELSSTAPAGLNEALGATWTSRTSNLGASLILAVTYGNSLYVAGGSSGALATSPDGITWTSRTSGFGTTAIRSLAYGNGIYVAVGDSGTLRTSTDGITWTGRTSNFGTSNINGVAYGNGLFVAVGASGKISTSTDGVTWTAQTSGVSDLFNTVHYGNGLFVAGTFASTIFTSPDGVTWTSRGTALGGQAIWSIVYANGLYVACGNNGALATSTDTITWTSRTSGLAGDLNGVAYGNGTYVIVGASTSAITSTDGINWTTRASAFTTGQYKLVYGNNLLVSVGQSGTIFTSAPSNYIYLAIA